MVTRLPCEVITGGKVEPQYFPINIPLFSIPSYIVSESNEQSAEFDSKSNDVNAN